MNEKIFKKQEFFGFFISIFVSILSWNIYSLLNKGILGVLFGSVNQSIWEMSKGLILSYILYALFELITAKPYFRQFVTAKFLGLYAVFLSYIALRSLFSQAFNSTVNLIIAVFSLAMGYLISSKLTASDYPLRALFPTACFMILLLFVLCFSFTAFPPQGLLFQDPVTGLYGIVPDYVDVGAIMLDKLYA